jgi:demethylmenaquinone methyltransferase/2-methoxy-6-polyprenyl-1,4-benzoquinol methylase
MFDAIAARYELVNKLMTFGLDARWRRRAVSDLRLPERSVVLDIAAGTGDFTRELFRQGHRAVATDLSYGMLENGREMPERVQADASTLPFRDAVFDGVTCGYALRNFTDLAATFDEMARVVRPGGRLSLLEVAEPESGLLRAGFRLWFRRVVPFIGSLVSDRAAYHYLPRSTAYLPTSDVVVSMLNASGFSAVNHRRVMGGLSQQFVATRTS